MDSLSIINIIVAVGMGVLVSLFVNFVHSSLKKRKSNGFLHFNF